MITKGILGRLVILICQMRLKGFFALKYNDGIKILKEL